MAVIKLRIVVLSLIGFVSQISHGYAQFERLSGWVSESANSIVLGYANRILTVYRYRYSAWGWGESYGYRNDRSRERRQIAARSGGRTGRA